MSFVTRRLAAATALLAAFGVVVSCTDKNPSGPSTDGSPTPAPSATATPLQTSDAVVTTLAGSTSGGVNGTGTTARFASPQGIAIDASGSLYVADRQNSAIRKITTPDGVVTTFSGVIGDAGDPAQSRFVYPLGVAVDGAGNVYATEENKHYIRKITPQGTTTIFAGSTTAGSADGTGTSARFYSPAGLAFDASGSLYVADSTNNCIRKVLPDGTVTKIAGSGVASNGGGREDGTGADARFSLPLGVAVDAQGNVYVADHNNNAVRKITPAGVVTTLHDHNFRIPGTLGDSQIIRPTGVAVDASGSVYVVENGGHYVRKIKTDRSVDTVAGNGNSKAFADGVGRQTYFNSPYGIVLAPGNKLYVTDSGNHKIRMIQLGTRP